MNLKRGHRLVVSIFVVLATLIYVVSPLSLPSSNIPTVQAGWYANDLSWSYKQKFTVTSPEAATDALVRLHDESLLRFAFEEGSGTSVDNAEGNAGRDGTMSTGVSWTTSGKYGKAVSFDGSTSAYISSSGPSLGQNDNAATFNVWVKTSSSNIMGILSHEDRVGAGGYFLGMNAGKIEFGSGRNNVGEGISASTTGTYNDNGWHMISVTIATNTLKIYVDAEQVNITTDNNGCGSISNSNVLNYTTSITCPPPLSSNGNFTVGQRSLVTSGESNLIGTMDELRIFHQTYAQAEITSIFNENASPNLGLSIYANSQESGADLRFTKSDGKTEIPFKFNESFSASGQKSDIWLQFDSMQSGDNDFYVYYGNSVAATIEQGAFDIMTESGPPVATGNLLAEGATDTQYNGVWVPSGSYSSHVLYSKDGLYLFNDYAETGAMANIWAFAAPGYGAHDVGFGFLPGENIAYYRANYQVDVSLTGPYDAAYAEDWNHAYSCPDGQTTPCQGPTVTEEYASAPASYLSYLEAYRSGDPITYEPELVFTVEGVSSGTSQNGITSNITTDFDEVPFSKLEIATPKYAIQKLTVSTNALNGYTVSIKLDGYIQGLQPANKIDPFGATNVSWTTPQNWSMPNGSEANTDSGWVGANTSDTRVTGWSDATGKFGPLSSTAHPVMYGSDMDSSASAYVGFAIEISAFQPSDEYSGTLFYNVIPEY